MHHLVSLSSEEQSLIITEYQCIIHTSSFHYNLYIFSYVFNNSITSAAREGLSSEYLKSFSL